jgi:lysozyme
MPSSAQKTPPKAPALIAAAVLLATPITAAFEGYTPKAAPDPVGIPTACFGERIDQSDLESGRIYSRDECMARLRRRLGAEYAPPILACLPQLNDRKRLYVFAALIDASWNAGPKNVCASRMAVSIRAGNWKAACDGFRSWHVKPKNKVLRGLVRRRETEAALCMKSV